MRHTPLLFPMLGLVACLSGDVGPSSAGVTPAETAKATGPAALPSSEQARVNAPPRGDIDQDLATLRDPFQNLMSTPLPPTFTRDASFAETPVTDLHVRGTLTASGAAYAIIANGKGTTDIVHEGRLIGAATVGNSGSVAQWRVDRVKSGEVVLVEEGPDSARSPHTYVIKSGSPKA